MKKGSSFYSIPSPPAKWGRYIPSLVLVRVAREERGVFLKLFFTLSSSKGFDAKLQLLISGACFMAQAPGLCVSAYMEHSLKQASRDQKTPAPSVQRLGEQSLTRWRRVQGCKLSRWKGSV
jgi:hypothetical protein